MWSPVRSSAFVMIEAVVLVIVLSVGLAGVFQCFRASIEAAEISNASFVAETVAQTRMCDVEMSPAQSVGTLTGTVSRPSRNYGWRTTVTRSKDPGLLRVRVEVSYEVRGRERGFELDTLVYYEAETGQ